MRECLTQLVFFCLWCYNKFVIFLGVCQSIGAHQSEKMPYGKRDAEWDLLEGLL